jgi:hypothetical protein
MPSFGMLRNVALVKTDVLEKVSAYIIQVTRICELGGKTLVSSPILVTLMMEAIRSF